MFSEYTRIRRSILDFIRQYPEESMSPQDFANYLQHLNQGKISISVTPEIVQEILHELYLDRIIVTGKADQNGRAMIWNFYRLTNFGKKIIDSLEYNPYDPDGYIDRLKNEIARIDETIINHLIEAINCMRLNYLLSASVMLGCAAEKAVLLLIECFGDSISDSSRKSAFEKKIKSRFINKKYEEFKKELCKIIISLPDDIREDWEGNLDKVFDIIRKTRNNSGHPTGKNINRDIVVTNIFLFPIFCRKLYSFIDYFTKNKI